MASLVRTLVGVVLITCGAGTLASTAHAQDASTPDAGAPTPAEVEPVVPPVLIESSPPPYPTDAEGSASVVLTIVVGPDGDVREVRAADGPFQFFDAAREAVRTFRFDPARRAGIPIAAVVRIAIDFTPPVPVPVPVPVPDPPAAPLTTTKPPAPAPPPPEEIIVRGTRSAAPRPPTLGRADIRQLPGAMGDPLRAIEVLPGVTPTISGLPFFYTRGAPPNTMAFYLDDLPVPYLFHVGLGPSILHPGFVRNVALEPAGGPARYGRAVGAFLAATINPPPDESTWEGRIRAIDTSAFVATPIAIGGARANVAVGTTLSYTEPLLSVFAPDYTLDYRDYAARVSVDLTPRDRVTLFSLGSYDFASQDDAKGVEQVLFASEIYRVDLKWQHRLDGRGEVRVGATWGYDRSRLVGKRFARDQSLAARAAIVKDLGREWSAEAGADLRVDAYGADLPSVYSLTRADYAETARIFSNHTDSVTGSYGALTWRPHRRLEIANGIRFDAYASEDKMLPTVEPRTALGFAATERVRLLASSGVAHQPPAYAVPLPALAIPGLRGGLQEAIQSSAGAEVLGPLATALTATVFHSVFTNLSDFVLVQSEFPLKPGPPLHGTSNGLELALKRPIRERWGMQIAYTLSRTTRSADGERTRLSSYDRTHVLNVALLFDLGNGWTAGGRALVYTGLLRDPQSGSSDRLPAFGRLDVRLAKRWKWGKSGYFGLIAEGINVTASTETVAIKCENQSCSPRVIGPLTIPSIGIEGGM